MTDKDLYKPALDIVKTPMPMKRFMKKCIVNPLTLQKSFGKNMVSELIG